MVLVVSGRILEPLPERAGGNEQRRSGGRIVLTPGEPYLSLVRWPQLHGIPYLRFGGSGGLLLLGGLGSRFFLCFLLGLADQLRARSVGA